MVVCKGDNTYMDIRLNFLDKHTYCNSLKITFALVLDCKNIDYRMCGIELGI